MQSGTRLLIFPTTRMNCTNWFLSFCTLFQRLYGREQYLYLVYIYIHIIASVKGLCKPYSPYIWRTNGSLLRFDCVALIERQILKQENNHNNNIPINNWSIIYFIYFIPFLNFLEKNLFSKILKYKFSTYWLINSICLNST